MVAQALAATNSSAPNARPYQAPVNGNLSQAQATAASAAVADNDGGKPDED